MSTLANRSLAEHYLSVGRTASLESLFETDAGMMFTATSTEALTTPPPTPDGRTLQKISKALEQDLFFLYYQSIRPIDQGSKAIREVLVRLPDEKTGQIRLPRTFLPTAARFGLMYEIDFWVVRRCFQEIEKTELANTIYSINLSRQTIHHHGFVDFIEHIVKEFSVDPSHICFEITEADMCLDLQATTKILLHLRDLGFCLALDRFDWKLSAFVALRQFPFSYLKVDGSLISKITSDKGVLATLSLVTRLGQEMGMQTIASHVSSSAIAEAASNLNFDYLQGFIISEPRPLVLL